MIPTIDLAAVEGRTVGGAGLDHVAGYGSFERVLEFWTTATTSDRSLRLGAPRLVADFELALLIAPGQRLLTAGCTSPDWL